MNYYNNSIITFTTYPIIIPHETPHFLYYTFLFFDYSLVLSFFSISTLIYLSATWLPFLFHFSGSAFACSSAGLKQTQNKDQLINNRKMTIQKYIYKAMVITENTKTRPKWYIDSNWTNFRRSCKAYRLQV